MSPKPGPSALQALDKSRSIQPPNGTTVLVTPDTRREISTVSGVPVAPRAQPSTSAPQFIDERPSTPASLAKLAIERYEYNRYQPLFSTKSDAISIPRPEKVKRVRPDKGSASPAPDGETKSKQDAMDVDMIPTAPKEGRTHLQQEPTPSRFGARQPSAPQGSVPPMLVDIRTPTPILKEAPKSSRAAISALSPREPPLSPRQRIEEKQIQEVMPPPTAPSQTLSAQELRETAKQTISYRPSEKSDDRRSVGDTRSQPDSGAPSPLPRRRTASPGTRNHSLESRTSGERRSDRGTGDGDHVDGRPQEREARQESRLSRKEGSAAHGPRSERISSHRTSARESERDRESDRERDRERGRDRHGERDRDRERDKERDREREKEKDRERRDRDRERDRDRDRDRDRHRRDDKDRDRESRKDRDRSSQALVPAASTATPEPRNLPTRPDPARHRPATEVGDDALGKRRRLTDDDVSVSLWPM